MRLHKYAPPVFLILQFALMVAAESVLGAELKTTDNIVDEAAFLNASSTLQNDKLSVSNEVGTKAGIKGDIFGRKRRKIHPFISLKSIYSDNIYNDDDGKEGDFITLISPGLWMSYPSMRKRNINLRISTMVPGGVTKYHINPLRRNKDRTYFLYRYAREIFMGNSSENTGSHTLDATYQRNFGKSTLSIADKFLKSHDKRGESGNSELNEYSSNLLSISFDYIKSKKFRYNLGYSLFSPDYSNSGSEFRSRNDSVFAGAVYYRALPKTSILGEYKYIDINYDGEELLSSAEHQFSIGANWRMTAKSTGTAKVGYGLKQFDSLSSEDHSELLLSLDMSHKLSSRNMMSLSISRKTHETNQDDSLFIISNEISFSLRHRYSPKMVFSAELDLSQDSYVGSLPTGAPAQEKKNNTMGVSFSIDYRLNKVFNGTAGYSYRSKKAEPSVFKYSTNELFILISASL